VRGTPWTNRLRRRAPSAVPRIGLAARLSGHPTVRTQLIAACPTHSSRLESTHDGADVGGTRCTGTDRRCGHKEIDSAFNDASIPSSGRPATLPPCAPVGDPARRVSLGQTPSETDWARAATASSSRRGLAGAQVTGGLHVPGPLTGVRVLEFTQIIAGP